MTDDTEYFEKYGLQWPIGITDVTIELTCYANWEKWETGHKKSYHMTEAIKLLWPEEFKNGRRGYVFSPWSHRRIEAWCEPTFRIGDEDYQTWWGPSTTGKSTDAAVIILVDWLSSPHNTTTMVCSTTRPMLEKRIWSEVLKFYSFHKEKFPGTYSKSKMAIVLSDDEDCRNGIFGIAIQKGTVEEAVGNIVGVHNDRNRLVIDEMQAIRQAAVEAWDNLDTGLDNKFLGMGNPVSRLDPLGKASKPVKGWKKIQQEMPEAWETAKGKTLFFDGRKSPGVEDPKRYPYLLSQKDINKMKRDPGEDSPRFWSQRIGFVPPEGLLETVLSESFLIKWNMQSDVKWQSGFRMIAGLDESFSKGGDRSVLTPARIGKDIRGRMMIELCSPILINLRLTSGMSIEYYLVEQVKKHCEALGIKPRDFGMDSSTTQTAMCAMIEKEWGAGIFRCNFGGAASDAVISVEDDGNIRTAKDLYKNRVTELWYNMREYGLNDQVRGLSDEASIEFCSRLLMHDGKRIQVEPKKEMKLRTGKSPDYADSGVVVIAMVKERLRILPGAAKSKKESQQETKQYQDYDVDGSDDLYQNAAF